MHRCQGKSTCMRISPNPMYLLEQVNRNGLHSDVYTVCGKDVGRQSKDMT